MGKFFEHQDKYSSRISDKINGHNEETDISFYLETSDEAVEKNALKTEVGNIQTETLDKQLGDCIQLQRIIIERYKTHGGCPKYDQSQQGNQNFYVTFHKDHRSE